MFYISSTGHSGTRFLSDVLNKVNINCYHGDILRDKIISRRDLILFLKHKNEKSLTGAIHLNHFEGKIFKDEIERNEGKFFFIIRNPIDKINTILSQYIGFYCLKSLSFETNLRHSDLQGKINLIELLNKYEDQLNRYFKLRSNFFKLFYNKTIYKFYKKKSEKYLINLLHGEKNINDILKNSPDWNIIHSIIDSFLFALRITIDIDKDIIQNQKIVKNLLKYEKIFFEKDYLYKNLIVKINPNIDQKYFNSVLFDESLNFSSRNSYSRFTKNFKKKELFENWPSQFKIFLKKYIKKNQMKEFYLKHYPDLKNEI